MEEIKINKELEDLLVKIGFSNIEAKIYLFLLEESDAKPTDIMRKLDLYKSTFYRHLDKLIKKGLVTKNIVGNKIILKATDPITIIGLLENLKWEVEKKLQTIEKKEKTTVETYIGKVAIKNLLRRMLKEIEKGEKEYLDFGASGKFKIILPEFWEFWQKYKATRKIKAKVIFTQDSLNVPDLIKRYVGEIRILPKSIVSFTDTFIYNDVIVLFIWLDEPIGVYIKNKENSLTYKNYFEVMWKLSRIL